MPKVHAVPSKDGWPDAVSSKKYTRSLLETGDLERFRPESALGPPLETGDLEQFYGKSACGLVKILRCAQDDSVGARFEGIPMGVAVRLHAKSARKETLFMLLCPKGTVSGIGSSFIKGRARKGWFSGTRVRFSMESCPKGVVFRHGTDSILHCRPQVSSQKKDTCCGVEWAVHFCRTSIRNSVFMPKNN